MSSIEQQISTIRPRIEKISPIAGYAILGFGILNVLLGVALASYFARVASEVVILNYIFNYQFWGVLFFLSGVMMLWGFYKNDWNLMRRWLTITLCFKFMWLFALGFRFFSGRFDNVFLLLIWTFITYLQALIYIHFLPVPPKEVGDE